MSDDLFAPLDRAMDRLDEAITLARLTLDLAADRDLSSAERRRRLAALTRQQEVDQAMARHPAGRGRERQEVRR